MIKNERQYRITKAQTLNFANALNDFELKPADHLHPILRKAQIDAVRSQYNDLQTEVREYESLLRERPAVIEAQSLEELPAALIKARIALGLSQKDLAEKMGLKEQQVQRYEATEYSSASLTRVKEVADALGVSVSERVSLPVEEPTRDAFIARLDTVGIDSEFLQNRLLPTTILSGLYSDDQETQGHSAARASDVLARVFRWSPNALFSAQPLAFPQVAAAAARFKLPGGAHGRRLNAYIVWAHYLGLVVANASGRLPMMHLTLDPVEMRANLLARDSSISLSSVLHHFWDCGVPVIPLGDSGAFHGACWRVGGRNVIVVKQKSRYLSRWIFDLLHEWHHAGQSPEEATHAWIEEGELTSSRRTSPEELAANNFAGNVVLNGLAEDLVQECVKNARGKIPLLKSIVPDVAGRAGVAVDYLANYLAWRLSLQGLNWWGAASNLQTQTGDPFMIARKVFYERFDFGSVDPVDAQLLNRALAYEGSEIDD
ncbi:helix-turn-helix domain-containing protein [Pseudoxanthomonas sp. UTMC 1351]|uniref:helix-turn-helix domain-containing protein n=1 Tax=Pseudoxanthomonas sp. UTMC 1351 TaxID=2695853 RepID=UPI0034CE6242